jgi:polyphosphate glucokinase
MTAQATTAAGSFGPVTIGIDVGGSGVKAAVVDLTTGSAMGRERIPTPQPATPDAIAGSIKELLAKFDDTDTIGCTLPAVVLRGVVRTAAHIDASWIGVHAANLISRETDRPCVVLNDADAAGLAEARFGAARDHAGIVVMVTIGTGVGTALLRNRELIPNSELGHLMVNSHEADTWVSDSTRTRDNLTWKRWTSRFERYLTHLHEVLWPELIVVGGGIVKHADRFLDRIDPGCEVRIAQLGNLAGIVGAAIAAGQHVPAITTVEG